MAELAAPRSAFLTRAELAELTGYVKPSKQIAWLTKNGVAHLVNAAGRPVVRVDAVAAGRLARPELGTVR
jgi:hypothetical protein